MPHTRAKYSDTLVAGTYNFNAPLGTVIHAVVDDGVNFEVLYTVEPNPRSGTTKQRTIELVNESDVLNDDGRVWLGVLSNGLWAYENTENTLPDDLVP